MFQLIAVPHALDPALHPVAGNPNVYETKFFKRNLNDFITELALKET